jgi:prolipoprotein diacylglyceryltransferase
VSPDPFRIQFLTIALDSQAVLAIVGLAVSAGVFRMTAVGRGLDLYAGDWWDFVTAAIIGGRLLWVATHLDYYVRSLLQVLVIVDGGLHPVGLVLGAAYAIRGLSRRTPPPPWRLVVEIAAIATVTAFLFDRVGCALTTCGGGVSTELPWALQRGNEWRHPVGLYQVVILAIALLLATNLKIRGWAFGIALMAFALVELISLGLGFASADGLPALGVALALYLVAIWRETRQGSMSQGWRVLVGQSLSRTGKLR